MLSFPRSRALLALCVGLNLMSALPVGATARFDFEQRYWLEDIGNQCKDHTIVKLDDVYHVFYIHSLPPVPPDWFRTEKWFGHLTTTDFRHWTRLDSVMSVLPGGIQSWEKKAVWAPTIIESPTSNDWLMYYTGVNANFAQRTGLASSHNLLNWYRFGANPIYTPDAWAQWDESFWSNCRDPEIFHTPGDTLYYMMNTASTSPDTLGAVSLASSTNLSTWTDEGPLFVNDAALVMESVQLKFRDGNYHLMFTEEGTPGISHMLAPTMTGAWNKETLVSIDYAHAAEITTFEGEVEDVFSRHSAFAGVDGSQYYFRFDTIEWDTPSGVPEVQYQDGLTDQWNVVFGSAFNSQPTWGDNPKERGGASSNMEGNSYIGTYEFFPFPTMLPHGRVQGDSPVGMIQSDPFTITRDRMRLLVGGGNDPATCFVALVDDVTDEVLFLETGNDSNSMDERLWNLETLLGRSVFVAVADLKSSWLGRISTDSIEEYDRSGQAPIPPGDPIVGGPTLRDLLTDAGYGTVGLPDQQTAPAEEIGRLLAPYPNPFNPQTRLRYELARGGDVELKVYDANGRMVRELFAGHLEAGPGFFTWDGRGDDGERLASGLYLARLGLDGESLGGQKLLMVQ